MTVTGPEMENTPPRGGRDVPRHRSGRPDAAAARGDRNDDASPGGAASGGAAGRVAHAVFPAPIIRRATGFMPGTMLRTPGGDMPVETLAPGDFVLTAQGRMRRICWIGPIPSHGAAVARDGAYLVHIAAHACAPGQPARDMLVLPDLPIGQSGHDEVLVPAKLLTNGATLATLPTTLSGGFIECWGIVLDRPSVLLANALPVGVGVARAEVGGLPPIVTHAPVVSVRRAHLATRAQTLGWRVSTCMDLHAMVDGYRVEATRHRDGVARFAFPARARHVRLVSRTFVPADWCASADRRALGIAVRRIALGETRQTMRLLDLDDPCLAPFFWPDEGTEKGTWRWSRGILTLPRGLWGDDRAEASVTLLVEYDATASQCWVIPPAPARIFMPDHHGVSPRPCRQDRAPAPGAPGPAA
ncbi:Hint domain-containing protein [Novacetimonas pomaceti]|uniref:Hedgehog/Intein (Hint) domain-containing protein n=1 Tax=Novacetimonas pomaceti TaxID=2021998 RepID=A0A318Q8K9_9PROT|nr:Hint domain-containing protein [Novacetimonas pomaceti]PYD75946.1 hypothetical protein CFR71_06050 [Novacetimonas pomaceti]